jgi:hypothetical protein
LSWLTSAFVDGVEHPSTLLDVHERPAATRRAVIADASLIAVRLFQNSFVTQAIAFRVGALRKPFVRVFLLRVGAIVVCHTLHKHRLRPVRDWSNSKVAK